MHMEELDLCWRLWLTGHKIVAAPGGTVYHWAGAALSAANSQNVPESQEQSCDAHQELQHWQSIQADACPDLSGLGGVAGVPVEKRTQTVARDSVGTCFGSVELTPHMVQTT